MSRPKQHSRLSGLLAVLFVSLLAVRALTPAGYMPASLADGTPFVLCPGANPGAGYFLDRQADRPPAHHHHHHSPTGSDEATDSPWEYCAYGVAFSAAAPAYDVAPTVDFSSAFDAAIAPTIRRVSAPPRAVRARGPPVFAS